jgi:putative aldouronate transport system substrate-binding protein
MKVAATTKGLTLWLCLFALLLGLLSSACSGGNTSSNGVVDLTLWANPAAGEVGNPPSDWFFIKAVHDKLNINLHVTFIPYGDEGVTRFNAAAAANNLPDLFAPPFSTSNSDPLLQWIREGLIAPVDSLFPMMPQRTRDRYSDPQMQKIATIDGKRYILQEKAGLTKRQGLFIRKDWLDKLGLQPPKTLDDFFNVAKAFTFNDPDGDGKNDTYGFAATTTVGQVGLGNNFQAFFGAFGLPGIWNYNTPGKISLSLHDPGYLKAVEFIKKMADARVMDPTWTTMNLNDLRAGWKQQGKYGIISEDFCAALCQGNYQAFDTNFPKGVWEPLAPPQGPDSTSFLGPYNNIGTRMAISKKAMDAGKGPAIAKLLEWTNSGEGYYLAAFGQEGVHYKLDAQGNVTNKGVPVPFDGHAAAPLNQLRALVYKNTPSELKSRYGSFQTRNGRTIDPVQIYQTISAMPWQDQTSAFVILPAPNQVDINRYVDENLVQFITGQKPLNDASWNAFIQGLDGLNVSNWEANAQKSLQEQGFL